MSETRRRWVRRLLWVFPGLLIAYFALMIADLAWFRFAVPLSFRDANWSGRWETRKYGGLTGRLLVRLPDPLPIDADFQAQALVYYPIYSVWKTGAFVRMNFTGRYSPTAPTSGGRTTNAIPAAGMLKFKGVAGHQTVDYTALVDDSQTRIVGGYLSHDPDDHGVFVLHSP